MHAYVKTHDSRYSFVNLDQHLITFLVFTFFVQSADKIISYTIPGLIETVFENNFITGSIISISSIAGLASDWILPRFIQSISVIKFIRLFFLFMIATIILLIAGMQWRLMFIPAMIFWGIYYDLLRFSDYKIINKITSKSHYISYWSAHATVKSITTIIAPLITILLLKYLPHYRLPIAMFLVILGFFQYLQLKSYKVLHSIEQHKSHNISRKDLLQLIKPIWPLYFFACSLYILDASFWTIGILLAEELGKVHILGNFILPAFTMPGLFVLLLTRAMSLKKGKKRVLFTTGIMGGVIFMIGFSFTSVVFLIISIFIGSLILSTGWPLLYTIFEEYILRVSGKSNELIAIEDSASNVGYIVGPFVSGLLVTIGSYQFAFQFLACLIIISGLVGILRMKHKVHFSKALTTT